MEFNLCILVFFLQYDTKKYPTAFYNLKKYLTKLGEINWIVLKIDNAADFIELQQNSESLYTMGGNNCDWEFSGWELARQQALKIAPHYDGVLFVNDSFEVESTSFLASITERYIMFCIQFNIPIGKVDYLQSEAKIFNMPIHKWIRSNCFILSRHTVEALPNLVAINDNTLLLFIDTTYQGINYFKETAPISQNLKTHITTWLSKKWHSAFILENNWTLFRNKTKAILNEKILSYHIKKHSFIVFDHDDLIKQNLPTFLIKFVYKIFCTGKKQLKLIIKYCHEKY